MLNRTENINEFLEASKRKKQIWNEMKLPKILKLQKIYKKWVKCNKNYHFSSFIAKLPEEKEIYKKIVKNY